MNTSTPTKKRRIKKDKLARFLFCIFSLIFFLFCVIFYGLRLIKYYKIYNPKSESGEKIDILSTSITKNASVVYEGDGLYHASGIYMFKGDIQNNYVYYSGMLWRIVKINNDNSVELVLDEPINNLIWNSVITEYKNSDVHKYLNDVFLKTLDKDLLVKSSICTDPVNDVNKITCNTVYNESYVKLLNITDYLNSKNKKTFINMEGDSLWLSDRSKTKAWYTSGTSIQSYIPSESYLIKPVITLKTETTVLEGTGTKNDPYAVSKKEKKLSPGKYVTLGNANWIVYETGKDMTRLVLDGLYNKGNSKYVFDKTSNIFTITKAGSLGYYLNTTIYNSLTAKEELLEATWYTGPYKTSYKDVYTKEVKAKVGLYNIADMKFGLQKTESYLLTPGGVGTVYTFGRRLNATKITGLEAIRPAIAIKNQKIKAGDGTSTSPYELEG